MTKGKIQNQIVLNTFGKGCCLYFIRRDVHLLSQLEETAAKIGLPLELALFDVDFFLNFPEKNVNSFMQLADFCIKGLIEDQRSRVELRINGHKKQSVLYDDVLHPKTLFPLYNVAHRILTFDYHVAFIAIEEEIGLIQKQTLSLTEPFDISKLAFQVTSVKTNEVELRVMDHILYGTGKLKNSTSDTVIASRYLLEANGLSS